MKIVKRALALGLSLAMMFSTLTVSAATADGQSVHPTGTIQDVPAAPSNADQLVYGQDVSPKFNIVVDGKTLVEGTDYIVIADTNTDAKKHSAKIIGIGVYSNISTKRDYVIARPAVRYDIEVTAFATSKNTKASKINKVKVTAVASNGKGTKSYKIVGAAKKYLKIKNGKIVFKKGAKKKFLKQVKKGKIKKVKVKAIVKGFNEYKKGHGIVSIKVTA